MSETNETGWTEAFDQLVEVVEDWETPPLMFLTDPATKRPMIEGWSKKGQPLDEIREGLATGDYKFGVVPGTLGLIVIDRDTDTEEDAVRATRLLDEVKDKVVFAVPSQSNSNRCHYYFYADRELDRWKRLNWGLNGSESHFGEIIYLTSQVVSHAPETIIKIATALKQRHPDSLSLTNADIRQLAWRRPRKKVEPPPRTESTSTSANAADRIAEIDFAVPYDDWIERIWACCAVHISKEVILKYACTDGQDSCQQSAEQTITEFDPTRTSPDKFWTYVPGGNPAHDEWKDRIYIRKSNSPMDDTIRCIEAVGVELRKNLLGDFIQVKMPNSDRWTDFTDQHDSLIRHLIEKNTYYRKQKPRGLHENMPWDTVKNDRYDAYNKLITRHTYHPVQEYLNSIQVAETLDIAEVMKILARLYVVSPVCHKDVSIRYHYAYHWLRTLCLGVIRRVYHPGAAFPIFPILQGPQGCGKSEFYKQLLPPSLKVVLDDIDISADPKDLIHKCQYSVIAECAEVIGTRKKEAEHFKALISSTDEFIRKPYERTPQRVFRNFVFVGSTNDDEFMPTDPSADRRLFILPIVESAANAREETSVYDNLKFVMDEYRDRIWSHFLIQFKNGETGLPNESPGKIALIKAELSHGAKIMNRKIAYILEKIDKDWRHKILDRKGGSVPLSDIARYYGMLTEGRDIPTTKMLAATLKQLGWTCKRGKLGVRWSPPVHDSTTDT